MDGDKVIFQSDDGLAAYRANVNQINADVAAQKVAQSRLLDADTQPPSQ